MTISERGEERKFIFSDVRFWFCLVASDVALEGSLVGTLSWEAFTGRENSTMQNLPGAHVATWDFQLSNLGRFSWLKQKYSLPHVCPVSSKINAEVWFGTSLWAHNVRCLYRREAVTQTKSSAWAGEYKMKVFPHLFQVFFADLEVGRSLTAVCKERSQ